MVSYITEIFKGEHRRLLCELLADITEENLSDAEKALLFVHALVYVKLYGINPQKLIELNKSHLKRIPGRFLHDIYVSINTDELKVSCFEDIFINITPELFDFSKNYIHQIALYSKQHLPGLDMKIYEHPWDRLHLAVLQNMKGLDFLCEKITSIGIEPYIRINYTGSNIQVTQETMPELHSMFTECCSILDVTPVPDFYIEQGFINAFTVGCTNPLVVMQSGATTTLTRDEMLFLLGHELGHIKSNHCLYHMMGDTIPLLVDKAGVFTLGVATLVSLGLRLALANWRRMSEFTADRAGLLCCQNIDAALSVFMKLSGLPFSYYSNIKYRIPGFIAQAESFEALDTKVTNKFIRMLSIMDQTHPWMILRAKELLAWHKSGAYQQIIDGNTSNVSDTSAEVDEEEVSKLSKFYDGFIDGVGDVFSSVGGAMSYAGNAVAESASSAGKCIANAALNVGNVVGDVASSAGETVSNIASKTGNTFSDAASSATTTVSNALDGVSEMISKVNFWK